MGMVERTCACGTKFFAKTADVKRGWGKSCSKSCAAIKRENERLDGLLQLAITRVGVVRFRAFDDMGSDLSYAVALLDSYNDGVILTSIFGREDSRSYVKPVEKGQSTYQLMPEEQQALDEAMRKGASA